MAAPGVDPAQVARAWELHAVEGRSARYIGEALGVSHTTAADYVRRGREAEQVIDLLDRAEARTASATRLQALYGVLWDDYKAGVLSGDKLVGAAVRVEERLARLLGLDAPTRVAVSDDRPPPSPDPAVVAAVREYRDRQTRGEIEG